ncbi:MAG TPA: hypothetical protein PKV92_08795 [Thermodesulfovibrio thiophilus]|nr:hypothetical protein [Thermodesulfovibrio thiophilus]
MFKKIVILTSFLLFILQPAISFSGSVPMPTGRSCDGSQMPDGTFIPAGQVKEVTYGGVKYRCVGCGSCTPISGGSSTYTPSNRLSPSQQATIGIMGSFLSGFFGTLFGGMFDDSDYDAQQQREYEEQQRKLAEEKKKQEEQKKQLLSKYNQLIAQAKAQTQTTQNNPTQSPFTFQTLGGQLTPFQWQSPSNVQTSSLPDLNSSDESIRASSDLNNMLGNVVQEKIAEGIEEKIEEQGEKIIEKLHEKYNKNFGSKIYENGLPIMKIAITAKKEGLPQAGAETIDYAVSLIPMPTIQSEVSDVGRKIYTKVAFWAVDKFLTETENAGSMLGFDFNKDEFWQNFENDMNTGQKIVYNWLKGD